MNPQKKSVGTQNMSLESSAILEESIHSDVSVMQLPTASTPISQQREWYGFKIVGDNIDKTLKLCY